MSWENVESVTIKQFSLNTQERYTSFSMQVNFNKLLHLEEKTSWPIKCNLLSLTVCTLVGPFYYNQRIAHLFLVELNCAFGHAIKA